MSLELRERLYREHGVVPILLRDFRIVETEKYEAYAQAAVFHPCPCAEWRIDDNVFFASLPILRRELLETPSKVFAVLKARCRKEAKRHIDEFYRGGTMDGVPA